MSIGTQKVSHKSRHGLYMKCTNTNFFCEGTGSCILEERGPYNHLPGGIINYKQVLSTNPPEKKTSKQDPKENQI